MFVREVLIANGTGPHRVSWRPGARDALRELRNAGWKTVLIDEERPGTGAVSDLATGELDLVLACTHVADPCGCRRPSTYLLEAAAERVGARPRECVIFGSGPVDVVLGQRAGARTIVVGEDPTTPRGVPDLSTAVSRLLQER